MNKITVNLDSGYKINITNSLDEQTDTILSLLDSQYKMAIITDSNLANTHAKTLQICLSNLGIKSELFHFPAGELHKTRHYKAYLEDQLSAKNFSRDTTILAIGGGVVLDMAGFVAATFCRGVPVIYFPTSLLAMADASIGGKTAVNTEYGKNIIGCFKQPRAVLICLEHLQTLPQMEWVSGMAEIIKHAAILNSSLFEQLEAMAFNDLHQSAYLEKIIYENCLIKKDIVEKDEHESGLRKILNFGHTIGHAIEAIEHYKITHGHAVALGMVIEAHMAMLMKKLTSTAFERLLALICKFGFTMQTTAFKDVAKFKRVLLNDKKTKNENPQFVMLGAIGQVYKNRQDYVHDVDDVILGQSLDWANQTFKLS